MAVELEGFINGYTSKRWYQERGCKIWDAWANPVEVQKHQYIQEFGYDEAAPTEQLEAEYASRLKQAKRETDDLGPIYGYQWRQFGRQYGEEIDGTPYGYDQLKSIVDKLHNSPYDRRMVCSAWNPQQEHLMALPPCHYSWSVNVTGKLLHLSWKQRSCDLLLGVPFNIASYALLQTLLCIEGGFSAGNLTGLLEDCHLYENQIDAAEEQLRRQPRALPTCVISWPDDRDFDIFKWTHNDVQFEDYNPHGKLEKVEVVV